MFPGEGGLDLVSLARAMPPDIVVSLEVPTVTLAKTMDAEARARRALAAQGASSPQPGNCRAMIYAPATR